MLATKKALSELIAADLKSQEVATLQADMPLRDAAAALSKFGVHGAPVVDNDGRCVGVLSMSDLARWAVRRTGPGLGQPRTCCHQETHRGLHGEEAVLCTLPKGKCSLQSDKVLPDGRVLQACQEPHTVLLEWQIVEVESLPPDDVGHYMTAEPVMAELSTPIKTLAKRMVDTGVQRVIIVDDGHRPVGVVSTSDLVSALAGAHEG